MRSSYKILNQEGLFFITSTIVKWIPVFTTEKYFRILIDSLKFSQEKKLFKIYCYVILDNHFHMIVSGTNLSDTMKSIKSFTAKQIISQLKNDKIYWKLNQLEYYKLDHKTDSKYQVWQESFHPQEILSNNILKQKLDYIHLNPVRRGYVDEPEHWKFSSAAYYISDKEGEIKIDDFGDDEKAFPKPEFGKESQPDERQSGGNPSIKEVSHNEIL